jgi:hypothetical protein
VTERRPSVSLGDGVRALRTLRPTDQATTAAILSLLDLSPQQLVSRPVPSRPTKQRATGAVEKAEGLPVRPAKQPEQVYEEDVDDRSPLGDEVPSALDVHPSTGGTPIENVDELPKEEAAGTLPPIDPLFLPRWIRGILSAALSVPMPDGPLDVERLVEAVALGEAIGEVPRLPVPTLRLGVHLLVDRSARMTPFLKDQAWLEWAVSRVVGENGVELRRFTGTPLSVAASAIGREGQAYPVPPGTPVLALTDLGIGRPMFDRDYNDPDDWLALAELLRHAGCPLVAFVPYPPSRWPRGLARELAIVHWDRVTTAATVRGSLGGVAAS